MEDIDDEDLPVGVDGAALDQEFQSYSATLSFWGARYAEAISNAAEAEERLKDIEAEVFIELRDQKAGTVEEIKAKVRQDRRVVTMRRMAMQTESRRARYQHKVMAALYAKKEMLISLGAHRRAELGGDPLVRRAIKDERRNERELEAAAEKVIEESNKG